MKIVRKILLGLLILIVLFVAVGYMLPGSFKVERSVVINAKPEVLYPYVASLKDGWTQWNPFAEQDPGMVISYSGPDTGVGATSSWVSKKMGEGTQTITKADTATGVETTLAFDHGQYQMQGVIAFAPVDGGTKVTWTSGGDWGKQHLMFRYMGLMMNKMMGKTFEKGLQNLKTKAETK